MHNYYSRGKLLLTGEYLVLHGAKALAFPLKLGQSLKITPIQEPLIKWRTYEEGAQAFTATFSNNDFEILASSHPDKAKFIQQLLKACFKLNRDVLSENVGFCADSFIEFNMNWGLGTSSTLINNLAQFAKVDPFQLNLLISKGSGYDVVCASKSKPIIFQRINNSYLAKEITFNPSFTDHLHLVYLNKKMPTEKNISNFLTKKSNHKISVDKISQITQEISLCQSLPNFIDLLTEHESLISTCIEEPTIQSSLFNDFNGIVKSLGAWGGDFVLAASPWDQKKQLDYFNNKGYKTVIPFKDLVV